MTDDIISELITQEQDRQRAGLELIPSENYVSRDVLTALGSEFTNKYSEGYPGKRYYGGQEFTDAVEQLAIDRAKELFGADHANVQPHSGAPANEAVYSAWCEPGDTILAMDLSHGGHLTHGAPVTRSAQLYNFVRYKMKDVSTGEIDYDELRQLALTHKPKIILAGFSSYPRELDYERFVAIGQEVGALLMADMAHIAGLIAGGVAKNPLACGFHVMTTTTHKTLRGPRGGLILSMGTVSNPLKKPDKTLENVPTLIDRAVFPGMNMDNLPFMGLIATVAKGRALVHDWSYENRAIYFLELTKLNANIELLDPHRVYIEGPTKWKPADVVAPPALRPTVVVLLAMLATPGVSKLRNVYQIDRGYEQLAARLNELGADISPFREI